MESKYQLISMIALNREFMAAIEETFPQVEVYEEQLEILGMYTQAWDELEQDELKLKNMNA